MRNSPLSDDKNAGPPSNGPHSQTTTSHLPASVRTLLDAADERHTTCGTGTMIWRCWGQGRPLVLLHGGSGSWTHWLRNIEALAASGRQVWAPDLPGFGDSAPPSGGNDADAAAEPLAHGMRELMGEGPHEIVAFSFGSLISVLMAAQYPALVARMMLIGLPIVPLPQGRGVVLRSLRDAVTPEQRAAAHRANLAALMIHNADRIDDDTVALQAANVVRDRMRGRRLVTTDACARAVEKLRCEFHCVYGEQDVLYRDRWPQMRAACEASPNCKGFTLIEDAGHWVQYEQAQACNALLTAWARS